MGVAEGPSVGARTLDALRAEKACGSTARVDV
jgi:hypothetical protein